MKFKLVPGLGSGLRTSVEAVQPVRDRHQGLPDQDQAEIASSQGVHQNCPKRFSTLFIPLSLAFKLCGLFLSELFTIEVSNYAMKLKPVNSRFQSR